MIGTPSFSWKGTGHTWICMPESLRQIIHQACARSHFLSAAAGRYWIPVAFKSLKQSFEKKTNWTCLRRDHSILSFEHFWLSASPLLVAGTDSTCKMLHQTGLELARSCQDLNFWPCFTPWNYTGILYNPLHSQITWWVLKMFGWCKASLHLLHAACLSQHYSDYTSSTLSTQILRILIHPRAIDHWGIHLLAADVDISPEPQWCLNMGG